jgi:hypothetical protein
MILVIVAGVGLILVLMYIKNILEDIWRNT